MLWGQAGIGAKGVCQGLQASSTAENVARHAIGLNLQIKGNVGLGLASPFLPNAPGLFIMNCKRRQDLIT